MTKQSRTKLKSYKITTRHVPAGGDPSWGAVWVWATTEAAARRGAAAHMAKAEVTEVEVVDEFLPGAADDAHGRPDARRDYEPAGRLRMPRGDGLE
jgi:hypothetical protein